MDNSAYLNRPARRGRNGADTACKSFQEDEASFVCPRTISAEYAFFLDTANFVRSCLCMIAGIPFANSDRRRWGHSVGGIVTPKNVTDLVGHVPREFYVLSQEIIIHKIDKSWANFNVDLPHTEHYFTNCLIMVNYNVFVKYIRNFSFLMTGYLNRKDSTWRMQ